MKDGKHNDLFGFDAVVHAVWEPTNEPFVHTLPDLSISPWVIRSMFEHVFHCGYESDAEASAATLVPVGRFIELEAGVATKYDRQAHF